MVNYEEAFKRPFQDVTKLLIGLVFSIIPIVNFLAMGYTLKVAKASMKKDYKMPEWTEWGDLFGKGIMNFLICLIYAIPLIIIIILFAGAIVSSMIAEYMASGMFTPASTLATLYALGTIFSVMCIVALITGYVLPAALISYASSWKFSDAFMMSAIFKKVLTVNYFVPWFISGAYAAVLGTILMFVPWIGSPIAGFITWITGFTLMGEALGTSKKK